MRGVFTVAKWEILRSKGVINREYIFFFVIFAVLLLLFATSTPESQIEMNAKIYTVAIVEDEYLPLISSDNRFEVIVTDRDEGLKALEAGDVDILILGSDAFLYDRDKSYAALSALEDTSKSYRINFLNKEVESGKFEFYDAFPVWISVEYLEREEGFTLSAIKENEWIEPENTHHETLLPTTTYTTGPATTARLEDPESSERSEKLKERLFEGSSSTTPSELTPPLPFRAILISFIFIFPLYFLTQLYSSSIMEERINRRGEFLLVSPIKTWEIVVGKLLPYLLLSILIMIAILIYLDRTPMETFEIIMIILPVSLFFLAIFFIAGILTRSFKELTFISVFFAAITSGYLFFPAVFMNIHAISTISPMTLVIRILEGGGIDVQEYLFSTLPFYLTSIVIFAGGISIFREEDLFTEKPVHEKMLDIFDLFLRRDKIFHIYLAVLLLSIFLIPFAYMAELMSISLLFSIPLPYSVIGVIIAAASAEEIIKSGGPATVLIRGITKSNIKNALLLGIFSGLGFFLAEKLLLLVAITSITGSIFGASIFFTGKLILPLVLHTTTATIPALGIYRYGKMGFLPFLLLSIIAHSLYNLTIVWGYISG
ncbi:MAG: ABC transporter permease [Candidatus Syntrophoarchaeum sp.]|nr:ABC transporter permease [Candidatus Syntrophoarchaeum sp.]